MLKQLLKHKKIIITFLVIVVFLIFVKGRGFKKISENYRTRSWLVWFIFKLLDSLFRISYRIKKVSAKPSL